MIDYTAEHWQSAEPSLDEIKARAADIRATWTEAERARRYRADGLAIEPHEPTMPPHGIKVLCRDSKPLTMK